MTPSAQGTKTLPWGQQQGGEVPCGGINVLWAGSSLQLSSSNPGSHIPAAFPLLLRDCHLLSFLSRYPATWLFASFLQGEKKKYFCSAPGKCQKWCNLWCASVFLCILKLRTNAKSSALDYGGFWFTYIKILLWFPIIYFCKQNWILVTKLSASPAVWRQKPECATLQSKEFETRSWSTLSDLRLSSALPFWNILAGSEVNSSL